jgi:RNA polymerase sigma-70 factor (ECF subfamily)
MDSDVERDFRDFVVARSPALLATAYLLTGDRGIAEDLVQATLLRAYRHWARICAVGDPEAYVRRVLANQRISWWRRHRVTEAVTATPPDLSVADATGAIVDRDLLWRLLQQMAPRTRAVLVLRYWEDRSEAETAEILGCSVGTVKSQASRGLQRMRGRLAAAEREPVPTSGGERV